VKVHGDGGKEARSGSGQGFGEVGVHWFHLHLLRCKIGLGKLFSKKVPAGVDSAVAFAQYSSHPQQGKRIAMDYTITPALSTLAQTFQVGNHVLNFGSYCVVLKVRDNGDLELMEVGLGGSFQKFLADPAKCRLAEDRLP
jgi:hypothetical protein